MASTSSSETKIQVNCTKSGDDKHGCGCNCHRVPVTLRDHFWKDPFFSSNWEDFDKIRQQMIEDSKRMWQKFDEEFSRMGTTSSSSSMTSSLKSSNVAESSSGGENLLNTERPIFPSGFSRLPSIFNRDFDNSDFPPKFKDDQIIKVKNDEKAFEVSLDTHHFRPDELKVNVHDNMLSVEAKHEEKSDDGISRFVSRQFVRKYTLPDGCQPEQVSSNLSSDGVLLITAPKKPVQPAITDLGRTVPITLK
jgi:HSP20 family molecular chaperone IbpA